MKSKGKTKAVGVQGSNSFQLSVWLQSLSTYIWAKLRNVASWPHLSVWLITVTGQASNQHSSIPTLVNKKRYTHMGTKVHALSWSATQSLGPCTASYHYMTAQKPREHSIHKWSVLKPNFFFCAVCCSSSQWKSFKMVNHCTTNKSIYFIR